MSERGKLAAVDRYLIEKGQMKHIDAVEGISSISVRKKQMQKEMINSTYLIQKLVYLMLDS
jgi:predicted glycosyltransferase